MLTLSSRPDRLVGRRAETQRLTELTGRAAAGHGGALVLAGEAGIGKSALLGYAAQTAAAFRVVHASGSEFEQELPYSGLHQLCLPLLDRLSELPPRSRDALRVAFSLAEGPSDPFQIGMAALGLLTAAAQHQPLLCLIDDAQWLDEASAQVMLFLARRVTTDPVAMLFGVRTRPDPDGFGELPRLTLPGLSDEEAKTLLVTRSPFPLDDQVRDRLIAEAQGSPLALLELPRAGGFVPPDGSSVPTRIEDGFRSRLDGLSPYARLLLIVASADPTGDPGLLWAAAGRLGLDLTASSDQAANTGLAEFGHRIRFCHPLARSAVYRAASAGERRTAHGALAEATDPTAAPDRRAWHRAQAGAGPDDGIADELEQSAARAQARGGVAAAAAFLERSVALSLDPARRTERTLAATQAHLDAGMTDRASELLATLETAALDEYQRARVDQLHGRVAFTRQRDDTGPKFMARAAQRLSARHPAQARDCFLDALEMSLVVGRAGGVIRDVVATARAAAPASPAPDLLDALIELVSSGYPAAIPLLRRTLDGAGEPLWVRRPALAVMVTAELWDVETHSTIAAWLVKQGRESGSPALLQLGLGQTVIDAALVGDLGRAIAATAEEAAIADAAGVPPLAYHRLHLAAQRGRRQDFQDVVDALDRAPTRAGHVTNIHATAATLNNGLADYPAALAAARRVAAQDDIFLTGSTLPELIEAAVRCNEHAAAAEALVSLTERAEANGTSVGRGIAAYARGLVTGVEDDFRESVELLAEGNLMPYLGRAHLLYGEWLRRQGRRRDCRPHLHTAYELLSKAGADGFARRAADELRATGEKVRSQSATPYEKLTMQEVAVARLVASGATSNEVAGQLFLSKRTVDAHLRSIFRKLGLTSRRQLKDHPGLLTGRPAG
ncbi:AAA family ATPase [Actinoplanes sp. CA-051413]|uniref:AAA family ATPase n=1 Tax=Actinoplanes sp. CA-051413 TaxID=3239899 RepID=UPI003D97DEBC